MITTNSSRSRPYRTRKGKIDSLMCCGIFRKEVGSNLIFCAFFYVGMLKRAKIANKNSPCQVN